MAKFIHMSDNHSRFLDLLESELIINSGDALPDPFDDPELNRAFQANWIEGHLPEFRKMIGKAKYLFCGGNHDYLHGAEYERILREGGIDAHCINNKVMEIDGLRFAGFPYVNWIDGTYNYELNEREMELRTDALFEQEFDVLVCHAPPFGIADFYARMHLGNKYLPKYLDWLKAVLCGHIHEGKGLTFVNKCLVSNAATTFHPMEIT